MVVSTFDQVKKIVVEQLGVEADEVQMSLLWLLRKNLTLKFLMKKPKKLKLLKML